MGSTVEMVEEMVADVPLLPFSRIREIYESTLGARPDVEGQGKPIINILSAELGYLLIAESEDAALLGVDNTYITKPVWILRGYRPYMLWGGEKARQMAIAQEEARLRHPRGIAAGLFDEDDYMCLDAQTGEVLNWPNLGDSYYDVAPTVLTWEESAK